jgi:beta-aspartyl-peptidase (threonine type)
LAFKRAILAHGGAGSKSFQSDGPLLAARLGMTLMETGKSAFEAVITAVKQLENDPRFNAGNGSVTRADGRTIQMDASCMMSNGEFGAVSCIESVKNPVEVAREVLLNSPHVLLTGAGATAFAQKRQVALRSLEDFDRDNGPRDKTRSNCDTVGAVAFDGVTFASALSSGGLEKSAIGRVGDVPLPGCGLFCGEKGAVACTGDGEFIALKILAREVYGWLEQNMRAEDAVEKALALFADSVDIGLIIVTPNNFAADSRNGMAWANLQETK